MCPPPAEREDGGKVTRRLGEGGRDQTLALPGMGWHVPEEVSDKKARTSKGEVSGDVT